MPDGRLEADPQGRGHGRVRRRRQLSGEPVIVGAPLAGGPSTPALAAAVSEAGGIGFLAAGYKTAAAVQVELHELRAMTSRPIGLNIFCPTRDSRRRGGAPDVRRTDAWRSAARMAWLPASRTGRTTTGPPSSSVAARERPDVVSFTFGCPEREIVEWLKDCGCRVWCTVTSVAEAELATSRNGRCARRPGRRGRRPSGLVREPRRGAAPSARVARRDRSGNRRYRESQQAASQTDTTSRPRWPPAQSPRKSARLCCSRPKPEPRRRTGRRSTRDAETRLTRAFTGRRARGHRQPVHARPRPVTRRRGYPEIHYLTAPIRRRGARARRRRRHQPLGRNVVSASAGGIRVGAGRALAPRSETGLTQTHTVRTAKGPYHRQMRADDLRLPDHLLGRVAISAAGPPRRPACCSRPARLQSQPARSPGPAGHTTTPTGVQTQGWMPPARCITST